VIHLLCKLQMAVRATQWKLLVFSTSTRSTAVTYTCLQADCDEQYEILNVLGFTSNRRRMSVIVRCPDRKIRLFIKGAVSTVECF